ncbi:MAG: cobalamin ABC transporter ATP-binding protein [Deltaproteobacteria bacterium]|nr:MAG: cobalamin ABC transporter ATP-binding protein [Deltaproteobacteria bacterium]
MDRVLNLKKVGYRYDSGWALRDVSMDIDAGELVGILGPNGSGKTTLLKVADRILEPQEGDVLLRGQSIQAYSRPALAREIAMVPQENHFQFAFSCLEVVLMGRFPHMGLFDFEGERDMAVALEAMKAAHCADLAQRPINALSGGEKQRVLLARALAQEPGLVLLDEPTSFLDLRFKKEIFELLSSLKKERGVSLMIVSHDIDLSARYCDRIVLLDRGRVYAEGTPGEVLTAGNVEAVYGCPVSVDNNPVTGSPRVSIL